MKNKKPNVKVRKSLISLISIIVLLSSILATTLFYQSNITANVVLEENKPAIPLKEIKDVKELSQLNEGWYQIKNGLVYYLETFDSSIPLYIKILNPEQQDGLLLIESDGSTSFDSNYEKLAENKPAGTNSEIQNQITGNVVGLESVTGFATKEYASLDLAISGYNKKEKEFNIGDTIKIGGQTYLVRGNIPRTASESQQPVLFKEGSSIGETLFGSKAAYLDKNQQVVITQTSIVTALSLKTGACSSDICKQNDGSYGPIPEKPSTSTAPQPPKFEPTDTPEIRAQKIENYKKELDAWSKTQKTQKGIDEVQNAYNAYIKALNTPNEAQAKAKFEAAYEKFQFAQKSPSEIINSYYFGSDDEKKLAKQVLTDGYNNPELMKALAAEYGHISNEPKSLITDIILKNGKNIEAYKVLDEHYQKEMDTHLQNNEIAKKIPGVIYVPDALTFINKDGLIVQISLNAATGQYTATATKERYEGSLPGVTPGKSRFTDEQQAAITAQGLIITPDGKITDNLGNVYSSVLKYNPQGDAGNKWLVDKGTKTAPKTIQVDGRNIPILTENNKNFETQSGLAVYKDPTGKLYDQEGNPIKDGDKVTLHSKFGKGENAIDTQIIYNVINGEIDKGNPAGARIGSTNVPPKTYMELLGFLKAAGKEPTTEGAFTKESPLIIKNEKGEAVAIAYGFTNEEGIAKGTFIQSNFKNGQALLTKIASEDGKTNIIEKKDFIEIDTGQKDAKGQPIKEKVLVTKEYTKFEEKEFADGIVSLKTERVYDSDKDGRQKSDKYTELATDAKTGEPRFTKIRDGNDEYIINYFEDGKSVGFFQTGIPVFKNGVEISVAEFEQLKTANPELYNKISASMKLHDQFTSQQFFADVERVFTEFQGLGYYSTLFFDEDSLLKWRDNVDRAFATLYLGTEYWSSAICGNYISGEDEGIAYAETPQGLAQVAAHIEATRSEPIQTANQTEFIYKITFNVRNGDFEKDLRAPEVMQVNVLLVGGKNQKVLLFKKDQPIKRGSTFGRAGTNAIVQESKNLYDTICLTFDKVPLRWKISNNELCNTIQKSFQTPTSISKLAGSGTQSTSSGGTSELNQI